MKVIRSKVLPWFVSLLGLALAIYTGRLYMEQVQITTSGETTQWIGLIVAGGLGCYLFLTRFIPSFIPLSRWMWPLVAILIIMFSDAYLIDDTTRSVFLRDLLKVIGVLMIFLGASKALVSPAREQQLIDDQTEIIEV